MDEKKNIPILNLRRTGKRLRYLCRRNKVTVKHLQEYLGLNCPQAIYRWFRGEYLPSIDHLYAISSLLNEPVDSLLVGNRDSRAAEAKEIVITSHRFVRLSAYQKAMGREAA